MVFQLGDIQFDKLLGLSSMSHTTGSRIAILEIIDNKPVLQRVGTELDEIQATVYLHQQFCNPTEIYNKLEAHREAGTIMPLITGYGDVLGTFVLRKITRAPEFIATDGNVISQSLDLDLIESVDPNPKQTEVAALEAKAFAKRQAVNVTAVPTAPTPATEISKNITLADAGAKSSLDDLTYATTNPAQAATKMATAANKIREVRRKTTEALDKLNAANELAAEAQAQATNLNAVISNANNTIDALAAGDLANAVTNATALTDSTALAVTDCAPLNMRIIRRLI